MEKLHEKRAKILKEKEIALEQMRTNAGESSQEERKIDN